MITELTGEQLKVAQTQLKRYLPRSQQVYGCLVLMNSVTSDPAKILVNKWPDFSVIVYKPLCEQKGDLCKDTLVFATDEAILQETIRNPSVIDWTRYLCLGINLCQIEIIKAVASEKNVPSHKKSVCHMMILEDVSKLPSVDSLGISLSSLDESHVGLVNQKWKRKACVLDPDLFDMCHGDAVHSARA
ncbi:hypothetical protein Q5P01_021293 [Channa striata]|uniref:Glycine N-acyltransferase-like protein n=1 Tax=Channa striata TaxID=64152 RepID=A0AA88LU94_CHASR|nr:hypothetical protein Q5P01_021293 [Channa striata]